MVMIYWFTNVDDDVKHMKVTSSPFAALCMVPGGEEGTQLTVQQQR